MGKGEVDLRGELAALSVDVLGGREAAATRVRQLQAELSTLVTCACFDAFATSLGALPGGGWTGGVGGPHGGVECRRMARARHQSIRPTYIRGQPFDSQRVVPPSESMAMGRHFLREMGPHLATESPCSGAGAVDKRQAHIRPWVRAQVSQHQPLTHTPWRVVQYLTIAHTIQHGAPISGG